MLRAPTAQDWTPRHGFMFAVGLVFLLVLFAASVIAASFSMPTETAVTVELLPPQDGNIAATLLPTGEGVLHPGGDATVRVRMHFVLPPRTDADLRWAVVFGRDLFDEIHVASGQWQSETRSFFQPDSDEEGAIPSFFVFTLPAQMSGPVQLDVVARSSTPGVLRPFVMPENIVRKMEQRAIALTMAVYAGLFMLALVMLALFYAAHDRAFLSYFGFSISALLMLAALNGHLYLLPGFSLLGSWREQGVSALAMLFSAAALHILLRYSDAATASPRLNKAANIFCGFLLLLSAMALMDVPLLRGTVRAASLAGWLGASIGCIVISTDAGRRAVPMAWPIMFLCTLNFVAAVGAEMLSRGVVPDVWWIRRGYQATLLVTAALLAVGLASRIGTYRVQRDRARLAREDSELRVTRQSARLSLSEGLQAQLKDLPAGDVEWTAYRRVIEHLHPMLQLDSIAITVHGEATQDLLLVEPADRTEHFARAIAQRQGMLKGLVRTRAPLQISLHEARAEAHPQSAVVPLPIRSPGWGVIILERAQGDGFTNDELTIVAEFGRLATQAVEEASAAMRLRRSAELDALTGTFNRRSLDQWLTRCFGDAHRASKDLSVLFVDLDHFKQVNDTHGHAAGDHCLRRTSAALREMIGAGDLLGRYGGEEFIVLLPGATSDSARQLGERIRLAVESQHIEWNGTSLPITVSVGVATRSALEQTPTATIERADKALYAAKRSGRNRVCVAPAEFV
ncbi:MAG: GGDEF domain-containing protein [Lysobacter sp.]|nr:GGDEF domain-containing protein [Lysobacter sp.]